MKVLLVNPPVVRYNGKFKNLELTETTTRFIGKLNKLCAFAFNTPLNNALIRTFKLQHSKIEYGNRAGSRWPETFETPCIDWNFPFVMALTTSYLRANNIQTDMIDCVAEYEYSYRNFFKRVKQYKPDIVIIECSTPTIEIDLWVAKKISAYADVALAGPHLTSKTTPDLIKQAPFIKYFLKGEYIKSALTMVKTKRKGAYEIELSEFDELPFMARDFKGAQNVYDGTMPTEKPQLVSYASKGCPFSCVYCLWPHTMYNHKCSLRDPKLVAQEIKENLKKHNYKSIFFDDDTFNVGDKRISELCDYLKEIGLPWTMMGRLDCSPTWLYDKMVECGCVGMRLGVESFNVDVLKKINKKLERIDFKKTIEYLSNKYPDIYIHLTMMKNLPGQTKEIHEEDMRILKEMGYTQTDMRRSYQLSSCAPFPGTKLYEDLVAKFGEEKMGNWEMYDGSNDTIMTEYATQL